jgi:hypothetical protein
MRYRKGQSGNSSGGKPGVWGKILRAFVFGIERSGSCVYVQNWEKWQTEGKTYRKGDTGSNFCRDYSDIAGCSTRERVQN